MDYYRIAAMTFVRAQQPGGYSMVCFVRLRGKPELSHSEPVSGEYPLVAETGVGDRMLRRSSVAD